MPNKKDRSIPIMPKSKEGRILLWGLTLFVVTYAGLQVFNDLVDVGGIWFLSSFGILAPTMAWVIIIVIGLFIMTVLVLTR